MKNCCRCKKDLHLKNFFKLEFGKKKSNDNSLSYCKKCTEQSRYKAYDIFAKTGKKQCIDCLGFIGIKKFPKRYKKKSYTIANTHVRCSQCDKINLKIRRDSNIIEIRKYDRDRYWQNHEKERKRRNAYRKKNKDRINKISREHINPPHVKKRIIEASKKYRRENKEKVKEDHKKWREKNPEKVKEHSRKSNKKWRKNNPDKVKKQWKEYSQKNSEKLRKKNRKWYKENSDKVKAGNHRRRARVKNAKGSFTAQEFKDLCEKYNNRCLMCGKKKKLTADHIIPLSRGGSNYIDNIQPLCKLCNNKKYTNILDLRKEVSLC